MSSHISCNDIIWSDDYKNVILQFTATGLMLTDELGTSLLHSARTSSDLEIVIFLLEQGMSFEDEDTDGRRPIHYFCQEGYMDIIKCLVADGCMLEVKDKNGSMPIHSACETGHLDIVEYLIEKGCDINAADRKGVTPIYYACNSGHLFIVKYLIDIGCNIEVQNEKGQRPLHKACYSGHIDVVKCLVENGCDIDAEDLIGEMAIHIACATNHFDIVKYLIDNGCNIDATSRHNHLAPLHYLLLWPNEDLVLYLLSMNCSLYADADLQITYEMKALMDTLCPAAIYILQVQREEKQETLQLTGLNSEIVESIMRCSKCETNDIECVLNCGHVSCLSCAIIGAICTKCNKNGELKWRLYNVNN